MTSAYCYRPFCDLEPPKPKATGFQPLGFRLDYPTAVPIFSILGLISYSLEIAFSCFRLLLVLDPVIESEISHSSVDWQSITKAQDSLLLATVHHLLFQYSSLKGAT